MEIHRGLTLCLQHVMDLERSLHRYFLLDASRFSVNIFHSAAELDVYETVQADPDLRHCRHLHPESEFHKLTKIQSLGNKGIKRKKIQQK